MDPGPATLVTSMPLSLSSLELSLRNLLLRWSMGLCELRCSGNGPFVEGAEQFHRLVARFNQ